MWKYNSLVYLYSVLCCKPSFKQRFEMLVKILTAGAFYLPASTVPVKVMGYSVYSTPKLSYGWCSLLSKHWLYIKWYVVVWLNSSSLEEIRLYLYHGYRIIVVTYNCNNTIALQLWTVANWSWYSLNPKFSPIFIFGSNPWLPARKQPT